MEAISGLFCLEINLNYLHKTRNIIIKTKHQHKSENINRRARTSTEEREHQRKENQKNISKQKPHRLISAFYSNIFQITSYLRKKMYLAIHESEIFSHFKMLYKSYNSNTSKR